MNSKTLLIIKPDAVKRGLTGEIIDRFLKRGYRIEEMKMISIDNEIAKEHYAEHREKSFFKELVDFITSGPSVVLVIYGNNSVTISRSMIGSTDPVLAAPGTIRGDFGNDISSNLIHASDSDESASREIALFFG